MQRSRLGLFGGTFDPPHLGHVAALEAAIATNRFDRIVVTVAGDPYVKSANHPVSPATLRLAMAEAAFSSFTQVEVSGIEIERTGPSYTIDTVKALSEEASSIDLIMGADLAPTLPSWHHAEALRELVSIGIVPRPGQEIEVPTGWRWYEIPMDPVDLSSSFIRAGAQNPLDLAKFLPPAVIPLYSPTDR